MATESGRIPKSLNKASCSSCRWVPPYGDNIANFVATYLDELAATLGAVWVRAFLSPSRCGHDHIHWSRFRQSCYAHGAIPMDVDGWDSLQPNNDKKTPVYLCTVLCESASLLELVTVLIDDAYQARMDYREASLVR